MKKIYILLLAFMLLACASPTATPTAQLVATIVPPTSTPTEIPMPTPTRTTEQALAPYTIEGLRAREYESGKIILGEPVLETDHFTRYHIQYPSDGLTITGVLQIPKTGEAPYPVIVMNHGFFSRYVYTTGDGTDRAADFLNRRGYLTVSSDYRSWGFAETGESLFYSGQVIDVINLIYALDSIPEADTSRMGMWGHSMGGGITAKVLTIVDDKIKAAILYSSVSADFADVIGRWGPGCVGDVYEGEATFGCNSSDILPLNLPADLTASYFDATSDPVMLEAVSPLYHFDLVQASVQVVYGTEDGKTSAGTPPEWSKKMYAAFVDAGVDAEIFGYQGEEHSFIGDPWFVFMGKTQLFFDKHVKGQ
ncbi:MAG: acetylxylan esterase [Anaerolineales bacterium]|nr:acetylxylan esterase [Anaerolineales bacterium]MCB9145909.1 acetylxylan esterase [Anaerolineales bacterium]